MEIEDGGKRVAGQCCCCFCNRMRLMLLHLTVYKLN